MRSECDAVALCVSASVCVCANGFKYFCKQGLNMTRVGIKCGRRQLSTLDAAVTAVLNHGVS